ncbi:nucleotide-binding protein [Methylobacterium sp. C25]|uniref:nucleotide-binding protein n=1 Tax=Methylobacterium sp. C25 TaxID=2721622 RepID=UPI001F1E9139|nr:nucleotide-binding protein [Methylobacterium sp. C25]MCE4225951.1 nucleotide-binding protein [Methylobacterium sp. C25]
MPKKSSVHVFYSWQSDSPKKTNLNAIRAALALACKRLEAADPALKLVPDEATRDTSGSPNIALKILEKIEAATVFIADVTTVTSPGATRPCPNPNVGYELGYAVATLGWDRVILLFNEEHGSFPGDLPFDFIQNRASPYRLAESDLKAKRDALAAFLEVAVGAVLAKNPKRPAELRGLTREKIEHDHDVENMNWLMRSLHLPTLDQHILDLPYAISDRAIWFFENFRGVVANSLFSLYDPVLRDAVDTLFQAWTRALAHDEQYHDTPSGRLHVFSNPGDLPLPTDRQAIWNEIDGARREMMKALVTILDRLREAYIEINIHKTNGKAWKDYVTFQREVDDDKPRKGKGKKKRAKK